MKKYIIFNWKNFPYSLKEAHTLLKILKGVNLPFYTVVIPPFIYLNEAKKYLKGKYYLGAQNVFWQNLTPITGEITPKMLKLLGVKYTIIGHSERRRLLKENNEMINLKLKACLNNSLIPILCVGEEKKDLNINIKSFQFKKILFEQLNSAFKGVNLKKEDKVIIAYEPQWAIGTGVSQEVGLTEGVLKLIRFWLERRFGPLIASSLPLIYGGSVNSKNLKDYLQLEIVNGVLIGRASSSKKELIKILNILKTWKIQ